MKNKLLIASCQFAVAGDVSYNQALIVRQIKTAADRGARVVHFPEAALTGYAGVDFKSFDRFDWSALHAAMEEVCRAAHQHRVWVVVGSAHRLSNGNRPHNSLYIISPRGDVVDRYDKRFCTGVLKPRRTLDMCHYTPGNHETTFEVDGFRCGALICYDYRFPELYRDLKKRGVEVVFHSYHNGRKDRETFLHGNLWKDVVPATMIAAAASNFLWISATNSSARYSLWPAFFVRPDGRITGRLRCGAAGVLMSEINRREKIWDAPGPWRARAMNGQLHSGELVDDPRSLNRNQY